MIQVNHVSYSYQEKEVLKDISVSFPDNGFVVLLGKSGSGKTTFLSLLCHVLSLQKGEIKGNEREKISLVFQSSLLLPYLRVKDNVSFPLLLKNKNDIDIKVKESLMKVGLEGFEDRDVTTLSGGEKTRVSIARALVLDKPVLILDEPTGQLDEKTSLDIYSILKEIAKDHLVLMVSHDEKNSFLLADVLYELKDGRLNVLKTDDSKSDRTTDQREKEKSKSISLRNALSLQWKYIRSKKRRVILSCLFLVLNLTLVYFSLVINSNISSFMSSIAKEHYGYETLKVQQKVKIAEEGHLSLEKYAIPEKEIREKYRLSNVYPSLSYFLPSSKEVLLCNKEVMTLFSPVIVQDESRIMKGRGFQSGNEVVVNQSFASEFEEEVLDKEFHFTYQVSFPLREIERDEILSFDYSFRIVGISKEKKLLNQPTVFYDYHSLFDSISRKKLEKASEEYQSDITLSSYLDIDKYKEEDYLSHEVLCYREDVSFYSSFKDNDDHMIFTNEAIKIEESVIDIVSSLLKVVFLFLVLNLLGACLSEFLIIYSLYIDNIRFFALLTIEENQKENKRMIIFTMSLLFFMCAGILLLFSSIVLSLLIDSLLESFYYPALMQGISFSYLLLLFVLVFLISLFSSYFALRRVKDDEVKEQLEGED